MEKRRVEPVAPPRTAGAPQPSPTPGRPGTRGAGHVEQQRSARQASDRTLAQMRRAPRPSPGRHACGRAARPRTADTGSASAPSRPPARHVLPPPASTARAARRLQGIFFSPRLLARLARWLAGGNRLSRDMDASRLVYLTPRAAKAKDLVVSSLFSCPWRAGGSQAPTCPRRRSTRRAAIRGPHAGARPSRRQSTGGGRPHTAG